MASYKLSIETHDDMPHMLNGITRGDRADALSVFDTVRRSAQQAIADHGTTNIHNVVLLTDAREEAGGAGSWPSGDPEFPWIVDGESYDRPREHPVPCILCGLQGTETGRRVRPVMMTWNSSGICYRH